MHGYRWMVMGMALTVPTTARAQAPTQAYVAEIEAARQWIIEKTVSESIPGFVVAVSVNGATVWSEGFGWADVEAQVPVTPSTRFRIGSVSKTFTAAALGVLLDRGQLELDVPVQHYLPDYPERRFAVTPRQLAGHLAGVRHYRGPEFLSATRYPDVRSTLRIFETDTLLFEPGTAYSYSSYGWNLLSAVLAAAAGQDFLSLMQTTVFGPLGMAHTGPDRPDSIIPWRSEYYQRGADGSWANAPYVDNSIKWAGGGFLSSAQDLLVFGRAHLAPGYLSAPTLTLLQSSQRLRDGRETDYGMGWRMWTTQGGRRALGHTGGSVGGSTALALLPDSDVVVAVIANASRVSGQGSLALRIADAFAESMEAAR